MFKAAGADGDRNEGEVVEKFLKEGKLHFQRMFMLLRVKILAELRHLLQECLRKGGVDANFAKWGAPYSVSHDAQRRTLPGVIWTENDEAPRKFNASVHCARNLAGIHVPGVRHNAAERIRFCARVTGIAAYGTNQRVACARIELTGNHRHPQVTHTALLDIRQVARIPLLKL